MGGFEGGDEGGYWDESTIVNQNKQNKHFKVQIDVNNSIYSIKSYAKLTIFSKIIEYKQEQPIIVSRVIRLQNLFDTISFVPCKCKSFTIEGLNDIDLESNCIYKAYKALINFNDDSDILDFFHSHKVVVIKKIPLNSRLGGCSSNAASFLQMTKEVCNLIISTEELVLMSSKIGMHVPYFLHNYPSANVFNSGDTVEFFQEDNIDFEVHILDIKYEKYKIYETLKEIFLLKDDIELINKWTKLDSKSIINDAKNSIILNDFYKSTFLVYPNLKNKSKSNWFLSGLSSTFFEVKN